MQGPVERGLRIVHHGACQKFVDANGEGKSLDCWRQLADRGDSTRPTQANAFRTKAFGPPKAVPAKDSRWPSRSGSRTSGATSGEALPPAYFRMCLEDMCTSGCATASATLGSRDGRQQTMSGKAVVDWLSEETSRAPKGKSFAAATSPPEDKEEEWEEAYVYDTTSEQWICGFALKRQRTGEHSDGDTEMATPR